jgi:putative ABC transport system permease protein
MRGGRSFVDNDATTSLPVVIINETVARRWWPQTNPIGDRITIGRFQGKEFFKLDVLKMFVRQGLTITLAGLCIGIGGALCVSRWLTSLLFGVTATDPSSFVAVSLVLLAAASAASYLPARRAASIDPMAAIRSE